MIEMLVEHSFIFDTGSESSNKAFQWGIERVL